MTECPYRSPLTTFETGVKPEPVRVIPLREQGRAALEGINREMGLGLDDWDLDYYTNLFVKDIKRDPPMWSASTFPSRTANTRVTGSSAAGSSWTAGRRRTR